MASFPFTRLIPIFFLSLLQRPIGASIVPVSSAKEYEYEDETAEKIEDAVEEVTEGVEETLDKIEDAVEEIDE